MNKIALKAAAAAISLTLFLNIQAVQASTDKVRAEAYFNAISGGNAETITSFYADKAEFHWVGGPLAGIYTGKAQIKTAWQMFGQAAGDLDHKVMEIAESKNGRVSTVTARVNFIGPREVPVKFIMMYEDGKIINQIWQLDKSDASAKTERAPEAAVETAAAPKETSSATDKTVALVGPQADDATGGVGPYIPESAPAQVKTKTSAVNTTLPSKKSQKQLQPKKHASVAKKAATPQYEDHDNYDDEDGQDYGYWERPRHHYGFGYYGFRRFYR